jgi:hypothetical protein
MSGTIDSSVNSTSEITFFYTGDAGGIVREIFEPIASEAKSRGYNITYTTDFNKHADIGFYCEHDHVIPQVNSDLSIITFHGLDDSFNKRYYINENWRQYDIGLLPGQVAAEKWQSVSWHPSAKPQIGMYRAGWPKADHLFTDEFETLTRAKAKEYGVQSGRTVLYAPTLESDNKVIEFIESSEGIVDNTLIKLAPYDDADLSDIIDIHYSGRTVLEKTTDILEALKLADVVVWINRVF